MRRALIPGPGHGRKSKRLEGFAKPWWKETKALRKESKAPWKESKRRLARTLQSFQYLTNPSPARLPAAPTARPFKPSASKRERDDLAVGRKLGPRIRRERRR